MIGTGVWDYIFIRSCIFLLSSIAPLSLFYTLVAFVLQWSPIRLPWVAEAWIAAEAAFYLLIYLPRKQHLQADATHPDCLTPEERRMLFDKCHADIQDPEQYLSKWFFDAPQDEIKRENVREFFRWAFLNSGTPAPSHDEELEDYVCQMERHLGRKLEPGRGSAKSLRLTLDRVNMLPRSLTWYLCVFVVDTLASLFLLRHCFKFHRSALSQAIKVLPFRPFHLLSRRRSASKSITYWYHKHTSKTRLPILFIHGIGIGLYPYVNFLAEINEGNGPDEQVGILALEIMPISFRITSEILPREEMCREIEKIVNSHGWYKFVLVTHSYGSVIATHLLKDPRISPRVGPVVLIDPISFLLHLPDVAYNFTYRPPVRANEYQLYYFASKDMGVSHSLSRCFFWSENILWKEDLQGRAATISLGGRDLIVNTEAVGRYLCGAKDEGPVGWKFRPWCGTGVGLLWFEALDHAQVFDKKSTRAKLVAVLRVYCAME
ncbi:MAG: hypothetical protein M1829_006418 [Trizodia sp. TS-e1964]|nr:MAG: hypothetical protein M1829_006418 [Trizodia sp. TS-e1964]